MKILFFNFIIIYKIIPLNLFNNHTNIKLRKKFKHKLHRKFSKKSDDAPTPHKGAKSAEKTLKIFIEEAKDISNKEEQENHNKKKKNYNLRKHLVGRPKRKKEIKRGRKKKKLRRKKAIRVGLFLNEEYLEEYDPEIQDNILNPKIKFYVDTNCTSSDEESVENISSDSSNNSDGENKWTLKSRSKSKPK